MKKWHSFVILLLFPVLITSCSQKDNNPESSENQDVVSLPGLSFMGPNTASRDQYAAQTKSQISLANNYAQIISSPFTHSQPSKSGNTWNWIFEAGGGATESLTAVKNTDGTISWEMILNGNIYGKNYSSWKVLDGTTSADQKKGTWNIYDENAAIPAARLSWISDESGAVYATLTTYSLSVLTGKKEIINRPDKSGELKVYGDNGIETFQAVWQSDGSGQWKSYTNGQETAGGSWK
ncbi:MAG TPA: hypothetical protein VHO43_01310 [Ignavibacteriales bacterium]|nr:hypothetical protein [Ignavibacteriales bacterium]